MSTKKGGMRAMNRDEFEIRAIIVVAILGVVFALGIWYGKSTAIHNCYLVSENESSYVLNFNGTEHLYLKGVNNE